MSTHHKLHPLCSIFPPMSDEEFERLRDDIATHGQRQPILLFDGQILDGRHRHDACLLLKIEPKFETFTGTFDEAEALVLSLNLARRHLDTSQRSSVAAKLATLPRGANQHTKEDVEISTSSLTTAQAAEKLNVSRDQVQRAKYVNEHAAPEVVAEVDAGRMSINKAKKLIAALPDKGRQALAVKADAVDEMIAAHAAEQQAAATRKAAEAKPEWLADPDELDRPEETDLPPLPKTNTHYTSENRRTPDVRQTDRAGIVCPDDPRGLQDGRLYVWSEAANRLFPATPEQVWEAAMELRPDALMAGTGAQKVSPPSTKKIVDHAGDTKRFVRPTVAEVAAYAKEIDAAIDAEQFIDFYTSKDWMIGKNKMKDWRAAVRTWKRQQAAKPGTIENGKVRGANWEDDGTGWEDLRNG